VDPVSASRDPLAIGIAVVGLIAQCGLWFYWGGKLETRVENVEQRVDTIDNSQRETEKCDATQNSSIAVTTTQYTEVIRRLDSIDRKLETRR